MLVFTALLLAEVREPWPPLWFLEWSARVFFGAWIFALGACVGSFLNVVVYRLPRGLSLAHPGSRCPACGRAIRGRDNLPVLSWLLLGGRCRDCRAPIPPRYYYVELLVGLVFLLVAVFEAFVPQPLWVGSDLIRRPLTRAETITFWSAYAVHVIVLTSLLGAALIDRDGWRMPRALFVPAIIVALVVGVLWPESRRIAAHSGMVGPPWQNGLIDGLAGLAAGSVCGVLFGLAWLGGSRGRLWPRSGPILLLAAVGAVLGWQRVLIVASLAALLMAGLVIIVRLARGQGVVPLAGVVAVLTGWIAIEWASLVMPLVLAISDDPARSSAVAAMAIAAGAILAGALATPEYHAVQSSSPADRFPDPQPTTTQPSVPELAEPSQSPAEPLQP